MLDREGVRVAGEGDHVVVFVERQLGQESPGGAISTEHCQLHQFVPFRRASRTCVRGGCINKDSTIVTSVTSLLEASAPAPSGCGSVGQLDRSDVGEHISGSGVVGVGSAV
jgi:hypothetical protein